MLVGFTRIVSAGFKKEVISWAEKFDDYGKKIQITGYIEHTDLDEEVIKKARKKLSRCFAKNN